MSIFLKKKLAQRANLSSDDCRILDLWTKDATVWEAREILIEQGHRNSTVYVLISGWACRFKATPGQSRQIIGFILPGDHIAAYPGFAFEFDHGVSSLTSCEFAEVSRDAVNEATRVSPAIKEALLRSNLVDEAISREWLAGLGRRSAEQRTAHLFCELFHRLDIVGLAEDHGYRWPLTQSILSDALGLSPAHVNRTLQALRKRNLVSFEGGLLNIANRNQLEKFAGFNTLYLYLNGLHSAARR